MPLTLTSPVFEHENFIPKKYAHIGDDVSPPLKISEVPENTQSFVLICDDPDAVNGNWLHWLVWNIPVVEEIEEGKLPNDAIQGINDYRKHDYGGPSPPEGTGIHHYHFRLFALDCTLDLDPMSARIDVKKAMDGHILEQTELVGLFTVDR